MGACSAVFRISEMTTEVRAVRENELEEMVELQCAIFPRPGGRKRYQKYVREDCSYDLEQTRVVEVDGTLVSTLRIWDRRIRIGRTAVRMGGIGGVGTHPDHRNLGFASMLLQDTVDAMRVQGYLTSVLFTEIGSEYYRRHGWASVPMAGFRISLAHKGMSRIDRIPGWKVDKFDFRTDLEPAATMYTDCNRNQSGSLVRERSYWESKPAQIRGIFPRTVVRDPSGKFAGYLNYDIMGDEAVVSEVSLDGEHAATNLIAQFLDTCYECGIHTIVGEVPHRHPFVDELSERCGGDLQLTGHSKTMWKCLNLHALLTILLPELQERLDNDGTISCRFVILHINGEQIELGCTEQGRLWFGEVQDSGTEKVALRGELFWRLLLGESSWNSIEDILIARGASIGTEQAEFLQVLFPQRDVLYWAPDHF